MTDEYDQTMCSRGIELRTITVCDVNALAPHIPAWDRLAWDAPQKNPSLLPDWVVTFLRHRLQPHATWFCCFAYAGDELVGVLPVIVAPHPLLGSRWPVLRTPFDEHTRSGDIVVAPDHAGAAFRALLAEVAREVPNHLSISLKVVRQNSTVWRVLQDVPDGYALRRGLRSTLSLLHVQGDCDRYFASLGKMRRNLRIGRERLRKHGTVTVEMRKGSAAGEDFLAEFLALEASGWKGRMGTAIRNDPHMVAFYSSLVRHFAAKGRLEWHAIRVEGRLVAAQIAFRCGAALMLPKYAYDEDFAECMPGHLLMEEVIREAFSRPELAELNPMSDAAQHRLFHMPRDEYVDFHLVRQSTLPVLFELPRVAAQSLYQDHVRPRIPLAVKQVYRRFKRREVRQPKEERHSRRPQ
ncbi:GNAT family N-acetyltransferase [Microvirga aerophila]|uniref:GNAT family N-acetyltransferase n=1 Tax=Microvirga aerophila TaxID=670291 RepID=UPI0013B41864|nr:GNAT family N-acetyltransferase [Microvirga aerophila]